MVEVKRNEMLWAAFIKKRTAKESQRVFVVIKKGPIFEGGWFHGIGFWLCLINDNLEDPINKLKSSILVEEWIPQSNIDHVKSLMYRAR